MNHTPGPWKRVGLSINVNGRGCIATIPTPSTNGVFDCADNASLIAAAPDLLSVCEQLISCLSIDRRSVMVMQWLTDIGEAAAVAVAKAKGVEKAQS